MLKSGKRKEISTKRKNDLLKINKLARIAPLISGHPVQNSVAIHLYPCNPVLLPQNTYSILLGKIFNQIYPFI